MSWSVNSNMSLMFLVNKKRTHQRKIARFPQFVLSTSSWALVIIPDSLSTDPDHALNQFSLKRSRNSQDSECLHFKVRHESHSQLVASTSPSSPLLKILYRLDRKQTTGAKPQLWLHGGIRQGNQLLKPSQSPAFISLPVLVLMDSPFWRRLVIKLHTQTSIKAIHLSEGARLRDLRFSCLLLTAEEQQLNRLTQQQKQASI